MRSLSSIQSVFCRLSELLGLGVQHFTRPRISKKYFNRWLHTILRRKNVSMSVLWNICSKAISIWFLAVFPSYKITTMHIILLTIKLHLTILVLGRPGRRQTIVGRSQTDYRRKVLSKQKSYTKRRSPFPRILDPKSYPKKKEKEALS